MPFPTISTTRPVTHHDFLGGRRPGQTRQEYLDGVLHPLLAVDHNHQIILDNLVQALRPQLAHGPGTLLQDVMIGRGPVPASTPTGRFSYATQGVFARSDLLLMAEPASHFAPSAHVVTNPSVVIEVLMPGEDDYYTGIRFEALRTWLGDAWHDYVLIAADRLEVAHYRRATAQDWSLEVLRAAHDVVTLPRVGCAVTLGELYSGVRDRAGRPLVGAMCPHCGKNLY